MAAKLAHRTPAWAWAGPLGGVAFLGLVAAGLVPVAGVPALAAAALLLGAAVFTAVHHAEVLALRVGEPFGSILLALAITILEVGLIFSIMLSGAPGSETVARDTVFAAVMLILNGIVGVCLVLGGQRHHEQSFRLEGAVAALTVLGVLATLTLVLPNFTEAKSGPVYAPVQLMVVGGASIVLHATLLFVQTIRHREYLIDDEETDEHGTPPVSVWVPSAVLLPVALGVVILLAKALSAPLDAGVAAAGLPRLVLGVVIAAVVLLPEALAAMRAALRNRLQSSVNLALGSALATIGLTIPAVAVLSILLGHPLALGVSPANTVLLVLTLFVSTLTLARSGRPCCTGWCTSCCSSSFC